MRLDKDFEGDCIDGFKSGLRISRWLIRTSTPTKQKYGEGFNLPTLREKYPSPIYSSTHHPLDNTTQGKVHQGQSRSSVVASASDQDCLSRVIRPWQGYQEFG